MLCVQIVLLGMATVWVQAPHYSCHAVMPYIYMDGLGLESVMGRPLTQVAHVQCTGDVLYMLVSGTQYGLLTDIYQYFIDIFCVHVVHFK